MRSIRIAALVAAVLGAAAAASAQTGIVETVTASRTEAGLEIRVAARGFSDAFLFTIEGPNRIILDVYGAVRTTAPASLPVGHPAISRVRSSQYEASVVRIVLDAASPWPTYSMKRLPDGFLFLFPAAAAGPPAVDITAPMEKPAARKAETVAPPVPVPEKATEAAAKPAETKAEAPPALKPAVEPPAAKAIPAEPSPAPAGPESEPRSDRGFPLRLTLIGGFCVPRDSLLDARYGAGPGFGGEAAWGLWEFGEVWLGFDAFGRTAADATTGQDRVLRLMEASAGLRFRLTKGVFSPYAAAGAAYVVHRETASSLESKASGLGFTAAAGIELRIGRHLQAEAGARYLRATLSLSGREFDAGGFRFGGGLGWRF